MLRRLGVLRSTGCPPASSQSKRLSLQQVEALRAEVKGGPIPLYELVAATERDSQ